MKTKLLIGLFLLILFTACAPVESIETNLKLSSGEHWQAHIEFLLPPESAFMTTEIDDMLTSEMVSVEQEGINFSWRQEKPDRDGKINYVLDFSGQGYDQLNSTLLEQNAISVDGKTGNLIFNAYTDYGISTGASESKFVLQGGRIISSNGNQVNSSTVEWINTTGRMEAELTEASGFNWLWLLFILIVIGGGFAAYWFIFRKSPGTTSPVFTSPVQAAQPGSLRYCAECGTQMQAGAKFCPNCGATQQT